MKHGLATIGALAACHAMAQTAAGTAPAQLRPVVVTATPGLPQSAFDTAASIDAIDGAALRNGQLGVNLSESLMRVPGVVALNRQNYAQDLQISVRGFGARATFGVRGLRLYTDGIPATAPDGQGQVSHFDIASAGRLEVLRGPFSSLYGNSSGGVISLFTADGLPGVQLEGATALGSDGVRRHTARVAGEQGAWNFNFSALRFTTDGARDHSAAERTGLNGKVRLQPGADTRVTLVLNAMAMPDVQDPLGLTRAELDANPQQASPVALQFNTRKSVDQVQAGVILEHKLNAAHALKLTAWRGARGTQQFQAIPVATQTPPTQPGGVIDLDRTYHGVDGQWSFRAPLAHGTLNLVAGLYADRLQEDRRGWQNFIGTTLGVQGALRRDEENRVRSFDQYAQGVWTSQRLSVTLGVRRSEVEFESQDRYIVTGNPDDSGAARYSATTPSAGIVFHANDKLNVYAAAGKGFETPTFNELSYRAGGQAGLNFDLKSAASRQWELGVKAEPAPRWRMNAALFQARTANELVVLTNTGGRSTFQNAGRTERRGFEAAVAGQWGEAWSFALASTWLDATYASDFLTCGPPPCTTPNVTVAAGSRIPGIPRSSAFVELAWKHRPWGMEAALELRHVGRIHTDDRNTDAAPRANLAALRLGWQQVVGRWTVREYLRVDNVADRKYVGSVIVNEGNRRFFEPAPGRTWLAGVRATHAF